MARVRPGSEIGPAPAGRAPAGAPQPHWHALATERLLRNRMRVDRAAGLTAQEARGRLAQSGPNRLSDARAEPLWRVFLREIREPMILLLLGTGILYGIWGARNDVITIFVVILTLVGIEAVNEHRAHRAIAALRDLAEPVATVRRDGAIAEIPAEAVVPGDIVLLLPGHRVPADARLLEAHGLEVDESALTGESLPAAKAPHEALPEITPLAERANMAFAGTTVTRGHGDAVVVATGRTTELGRVAGLTERLKPPRTPLQVAMAGLARWLLLLALAFSVIVPVIGVALAGQPLKQMVLTGLALAFATIPEELPIIITMVLAVGAFRLSRQRAIVRRLRAMEALGAVTVIASDKTGTLTRNVMTVEQLDPPDFAPRLLEIGVLTSDTAGGEDTLLTDPLEMAILRAAREADMDVDWLRRAYPLAHERPFDAGRKLTTVLCRRGDGFRMLAKGAPEAVLELAKRRWTARGERPLTEEDREAILGRAAAMAERGLRVVAMAERPVPGTGAGAGEGEDHDAVLEEAERDLTFAGLAGFADPPREQARASVEACRAAGMRPVMITGDHPLTAGAVARRVSLGADEILTGPEIDVLADPELEEAVRRVDVYARVTPEQKLRIVHAIRAAGAPVAVTGDGVNDAPALAAADIGFAMGERGTDVAREAADIVLTDDNLATIVRAVREGRILFDNLRKGVRYYLACKVALVCATLLPVLLGAPVPFAPIQIILMELFMDLAAAATFVAEGPEPDVMRRPPRDPRTPFMDRAMTGSILSAASGLFAAVSVAYLATWYGSGSAAQARSVAFVTWLLGHVLLALNLRSEREPLARLGLASNRVLVAWGGVVLALAVASVLLPGLHGPLRTTALSGGQWTLAAGSALAGTVWMEPWKWLRSARRRDG